MKSYLFVLPLALLAAKFVVVLPLLLEDLLRLGRWAARGFSSPAPAAGEQALTRSQFISRLALGLGLIPLASMLWGMVRGKTDYTVRRVVLRYPNLPASFEGFKILQISDLHTGSFNGNTEPMQRAVRRWRASPRSCQFSPSSATTTTATMCSGKARRPSAPTCSA